MAGSKSNLASAGQRVMSVDVLRGLVMLTMVFVNDDYGAHGSPWWLKHWSDLSGAGPSGMTFVDIVFGAFLFIVGLSIPLAIENRRATGESWLKIYGHILLRVASLLFIGVLMVEPVSAKRIGWPEGVWNGLMLLGVLLLFHSVQLVKPTQKYISLGVRVVGGILLLFLAYTFRGEDGKVIQPSWWGILGLIGWAYGVAATCYLLLRKAGQGALVAMVGILMSVFLADHANAFGVIQKWHFWIGGHKIAPLSVIGFGDALGSQAAITMAGVVIGFMLLPAADQKSAKEKIGFALTFAALMVLAGLLLWRTFGISKNDATPTWCFFCAAITTVLWVVLYAVIDVAGWRVWSIPLAWAGASALLIYILADVWEVLCEHDFFIGINWHWYDQVGDSYPNSLYHKLLTAGVLCLVGGILGRIGFRLKL